MTRATAILLAIFMAGCNQAGAPSEKNSYLTDCRSAEDLRSILSAKSLGGRVLIHTKGHLVFAQTFPFSGVRASHLYVYTQDMDSLSFLCFFRLRTQDDVVLREIDGGSVEINAEGKIAVLEQPGGDSVVGTMKED